MVDDSIFTKIKRTRFFSLSQAFWKISIVRLNYQSFRLLLQLEGLLLFTAVVMEAFLPFQPSWSLLLRVVAIAFFGLLGWWLPACKLGQMLLYTALEFTIIFLAALQEGLSSRSIFLLCLVLVMRGCFLFQRLGQAIVLSLALLTYATLLFSKPLVPAQSAIAVWDWRFSNVLLYGLTLVFAVLLINALLSERQSREQLEKAHQELEVTLAQLRRYALKIEDQAILQERNRIAREIHDGLGHTLVAQSIQLNNALLFCRSEDERTLAALKQAKQLGSEALLEVRKSVSVLRSNPLQGQPLNTALQKLLTDFQQSTQIELTQNCQSCSHLPANISLAVYRIVQESLTNISKHARAHNVTVELQQQASAIYLSIRDNGLGFNPTQNTTGFGLQGMRERATSLGGQFSLHSQPGQGCQICVSLPLPSAIISE